MYREIQRGSLSHKGRKGSKGHKGGKGKGEKTEMKMTRIDSAEIKSDIKSQAKSVSKLTQLKNKLQLQVNDQKQSETHENMRLLGLIDHAILTSTSTSTSTPHSQSAFGLRLLRN